MEQKLRQSTAVYVSKMLHCSGMICFVSLGLKKITIPTSMQFIQAHTAFAEGRGHFHIGESRDFFFSYEQIVLKEDVKGYITFICSNKNHTDEETENITKTKVNHSSLQDGPATKKFLVQESKI